MVIGVEGNVHVGKTTFINNNYRHFNIIKESSFNPSLNNYDRQICYINQEKEKLKKISNKKNSIMDRTIISIFLYTLYSNEFSEKEQHDIFDIINDCVKNKEIIIPDKILYIVYPYKLIVENQKKLFHEKGTQSSLVSYDYYLNYSLFFSCNNDCFDKIYSTKDKRQILEYKANNLFKNLTKEVLRNDKIIIDDFNNQVFNEETNLDDNYDYCLQVIIDKICYLQSNYLIHNSFLIDILYILSHSKSKSKKISFLDNIMENVQLNIYLTKIICLKTIDNDLFGFYKALSSELVGLTNIHFYENEYLNKIKKVKSEPILLIDLLYAINCLIMKGII